MRDWQNVVFNLFLAVIPVGLSFCFAYGATRERKQKGRINWLRWTPVLLLWLVFWPNTCYLFTEWRHYLDYLTENPKAYLYAKHNPRVLFDFLLLSGFYLFYSGSGMMAFFLSLWPIDRVLRLPIWVKGVFFVLCALGVYLGLINRFNSWNLFTHLPKVAYSAVAAVQHPALDLLIVAFAAALWVLYGLFCLTMTGVAVRYRLSK